MFLLANVFVSGIFHWHLVPQNRYRPHTLRHPFACSFSHFLPLKFQCTKTWLYICLVRVMRHSQQSWLRFKHAHTHARNYRISTIHTHVENTLQRYVSVRRLDLFFFCGQRKSAECIIHRRNPWTLWNKPKKHGVNTTDEFCGYDYDKWRSSIRNSWSNRVHGKQALKKKMLLETWTMWRQ
jgi:hypothetical protein